MGDESYTEERQPSYRWVIAAAAFLCMFVSMGLGNAPNGQYLSPVTAEFGFSRADFSLTFSMRYVFTTIFNLLWGKLFAKLGPRRMCGVGFVCLSSAFFVFSLSANLITFYLGGVLQGIAIAFCTSATCAYLIDNWFTENKGTVLGVVFAASGIGGGIGNVLVARWIAANGWRFSYRLTACLMLAIGLVLSAFVRVRPKTAVSGGSGGTKKRSASWEGVPVSVLRHQPYFYVFFAIIFVMGWLCNPVYTIAPAHLVDRGFDPVFAGQMTGLMFIVLGATKVLYGILYDRLGLRPVFLMNCAAGIAALLTLAWASNRTSAVAFAVLLGFAMPIETVMVPLMVMELLGQKAYASLIGVFFALMTAGIAAGNPLINFAYLAAHSYTPVLLAYVGVFAVCALLFLWCETRMQKLKKETEAARNA